MACTSPLSKRSLPCQTGLVGCVVAFMLFLQVKPYQCVLFPQTTPEDLDCACDAPYSCSTQCLNKIVIPPPTSSARSAAQRLAGSSSSPLAQQHSAGCHVYSTCPKADALGAVPRLRGTSSATVLN